VNDEPDHRALHHYAGLNYVFGPRAMAAALVKRPAMYLGSPPTHERAAAFIGGFDMALIMAGSSTSLRPEHYELLERPAVDGQVSAEQELAHIRSLLPVFESLFTTAAQIKSERQDEQR